MTTDDLWEAQQREYPTSVRLTPTEVFAWCDETPQVYDRLHRYIQISRALQYPVHLFYRIEGTKYRGVRFGVEGYQYMSLYNE